MMLIVRGPHCFGCGGSNVVDRYFQGHVAWTQDGPIEGNVKSPVCLDCDEDTGSPYPISKPEGRENDNDERLEK